MDIQIQGATLRQLADSLRRLAVEIESLLPSDAPSGDGVTTTRETVADYLAALQIKVESHDEEVKLYEGFEEIALLIGATYDDVAEFMLRMRQAQGAGRGVFLDLSSASQLKLSRVTALGAALSRRHLIADYRYVKTLRTIRASAPKLPAAINFITGRWLELYAYEVLRKVLIDLGLEEAVNVMSSLKLRFENLDQLELDLCALPERSRLIWIEAKTTEDLAAYLPRYAKMRKRLGVATADALLLCSEFDRKPDLRDTARIAGLTPVGFSDYATVLRERLHEYAPFAQDPILSQNSDDE